jgi:hypothetical protein
VAKETMKLMFRRAGEGLGWFVRTFEKGAIYDHCELVFRDGVSFSAVADEDIKNYGVRKRIMSYSSGWDMMEMPHTPTQEELVRAYAEGQIGKPYSILSLLLYLPLGGIRLLPNWFICSDWCEQAITYGAMYWPDLKTGRIKSPTKLADALLERGLQVKNNA